MTKERKYYTVIDSIMSGEGQDPFCTTSKHVNISLGGYDFFLTDIIAVRYMGFDPLKIKYLEYFIREWNMDINEISVSLFGELKSDFFNAPTRYADFEIPFAWRGITYSR